MHCCKQRRYNLIKQDIGTISDPVTIIEHYKYFVQNERDVYDH
jgi:hypothetical protein